MEWLWRAMTYRAPRRDDIQSTLKQQM
jgi:hypothetical protein